MTMIAVITALTILIALAGLQVLVASGLPYGRLVWGGQHEVLPPALRAGSAVALLIYGAIGWILIARADLLPGRGAVVEVITWVAFAYFVIGIAMNGLSRSRAERVVQTPTCVALALCSLVIALS